MLTRSPNTHPCGNPYPRLAYLVIGILGIIPIVDEVWQQGKPVTFSKDMFDMNVA
jgi:hypothetical protein